MVLFDTNVLVHAHIVGSTYHEIARRLRDQSARGELSVCLSPQILCEFFAVCTDERIVHPALTIDQANKEIVNYWTNSAFKKIFPKETTMRRLIHLIERHPVKRQKIFDLFLVATMLDNNVSVIYTQNAKDFEPFRDLQVINPFNSL